MKIAYLIANFPKPSETFVSREVLSLRKLGLDLRPFAFQQPARSEAQKLDLATRQLIPNVEYLTKRALITEPFRSWRPISSIWRQNAQLQHVITSKSSPGLRLLRAVRLAKELTAAGIDHLHAHWPYATEVAYLVHKLTGLPFSASIHAHEVEYDNGHFPAVFESLSFASFCNRAAMEHLLARLPPSAHGRCHLIYHGVDLERFSPLPFPAQSDPLRVISAGRFTRTKGFDRLVRACARFHQAGGKVELTILGQGKLEEELRRLANDRGFAEHLHLPGWLPHDQVAACLASSHVFALMADTEFGDGLPNVVLEAMAAARPVILSPLPAASEAITDGAEGFILSSADDEEGCVAALCQFASDPGKLRTMGQTARVRMEKAFDERTHALHLKDLFQKPFERVPAMTRAR